MHGIAVDNAGRIYVGDRRNSRIQVFTPEGEFIEEWPGVIDPVGIFITEERDVWVVSAALNRLLKYNTDGVLQYHGGTYGRTAGGFGQGGFGRPHQMDVDSEGNVYVSSWDWPGQGHRFSPKPNADPTAPADVRWHVETFRFFGNELLLHARRRRTDQTEATVVVMVVPDGCNRLLASHEPRRRTVTQTFFDFGQRQTQLPNFIKRLT